jgi:hypothetical protein
MSDSKTVQAGGGIGISGLLGVCFVVLRLCHVIDWPWKWVLAPFWIPLALGLGVAGLLMLIAGIIWCLVKITGR